MCGRYFLNIDWGELKRILSKWGFSVRNKKSIVINARLENLCDRMMFRDIEDTQRCIVPASAYFEWKRTSERRRRRGKIYYRKRRFYPIYGWAV